VEQLKARKRDEALDNRRIYRPWGFYETADLGARYQVKRICVNSGGRLSLQKHFHRSEHWVVRGVAEVTVGEEVRIMRENESASKNDPLHEARSGLPAQPLDAAFS
jgi:mannose-1-phosphate guanylyltransferase/mannose-6-phosphate isomerase